MQINKDNVRGNKKIYEHKYKVRDKIILNNSPAYKYEMPYMGPFVIEQYCNNDTVTLQCSAIKIRYNIRHINPYKYDTKVEEIKPENIYDDVKI